MGEARRAGTPKRGTRRGSLRVRPGWGMKDGERKNQERNLRLKRDERGKRIGSLRVRRRKEVKRDEKVCQNVVSEG